MKMYNPILAAALSAAVALFAGVRQSQATPVSADQAPSGVAVNAAGVDPTFDFSFAAVDGSFSGAGTLHAVLNPDNTTFTATSGFITIDATPGSVYNGYTGEFPLWANPSPPSVVYSPSSQIVYDDQLLTGDVQVTSAGGLLFLTNNPEANEQEVNIFAGGWQGNTNFGDRLSNGPYTYYQNNGLMEAINVIFTPPVSTDAAAVPLPASAGVGFATLAGFGIVFAARRRLGRRLRIA
jgi:hypothetical protein